MLGWLKSLGKPGGKWSHTPHPERELELLYQDFLPLDQLEPDLPQALVQHVALGQHAEVLTRLADHPEAAQIMGLRGEKHACAHRLPVERDAFFATTTILDPAFHLRLAVVYETLLRPAQRFPHTSTLPSGALWLETYLWEATRTPPLESPLHVHETRLDAPALEAMLKLSGHPATWLARAALAIDTGRTRAAARSRHLPELLLHVPDIASTFTSHVATVRECLDSAEPRGKAHIITTLHRAGVSASLLPAQAAQLATSSHKPVREAAAAWILQTPDLILPELQKLAVDGEPDQRLHAIQLLSHASPAIIAPFLQERLKRDKAKKVVKAIETLLSHTS